jgi:hypothetical protein
MELNATLLYKKSRYLRNISPILFGGVKIQNSISALSDPNHGDIIVIQRETEFHAPDTVLITDTFDSLGWHEIFIFQFSLVSRNINTCDTTNPITESYLDRYGSIHLNKIMFALSSTEGAKIICDDKEIWLASNQGWVCSPDNFYP